jgi:signal transduction histidine kinase
MSQIDHSERRQAGSWFFENLGLVWMLIYYLSLGLSFISVFSSGPETIAGWNLAAMFVLVAISAALFQLIYAPTFSGRPWPMPRTSAWVYFGSQLLVLAALATLGQSFIGLGFALMGQAFGALRPRYWAVPLVPLSLLIAWALGIFPDLMRGSWLGLIWLIMFVGLWLIVALLIVRLFQQRYQLLHVVDELRRAKAQLEAGAAQQEELAVLRERTRLAREMHESIGHALVSVNVKLEAAQRLYRVDASRGDSELEATRALVRETMGALRRSLADLRAPLPDHRDMPACLRQLAAQAGAAGPLEVAVSDGAAGDTPPPEVAEALLLIAREALANVERHASASRADLSLSNSQGVWRLRVADNGVGLHPADLERPGHFGIAGMRERAHALGGTLHVSSHPEGGTLVEAAIPVGRAGQ